MRMDLQSEHEKQQKLLRNQMMVMAAFSHHPQGAHVHAAARIMQVAAKARAARCTAASTTVCRFWKGKVMRLRLSAVLRAAVYIQAKQRGRVQATAFAEVLSEFPDRSRYALIREAKRVRNENEMLARNIELVSCELKSLSPMMPGHDLNVNLFDSELTFYDADDLLPNGSIVRLCLARSPEHALSMNTKGVVSIIGPLQIRAPVKNVSRNDQTAFEVKWLAGGGWNGFALYNTSSQRFLRMTGDGAVNGHGGVVPDGVLPIGWDAERFAAAETVFNSLTLVGIMVGPPTLYLSVGSDQVVRGLRKHSELTLAERLAEVFFTITPYQ